jgi:hypothetical protein
MRSAALASLLCLAGLAAACGGPGLTLPGNGEPAQLSIVAGDGQQGSPGEALPDPLVVALQDIQGRPVAGARVRFQFATDVPNAFLTPDAGTTDSAGRAAARVRLGQRTGVQAIDATVAAPGEDLRVRFQATAVAPPAPPPPPQDPGGGGTSGGGGASGGSGNDGSGGHRHGGGHGKGHRD